MDTNIFKDRRVQEDRRRERDVAGLVHSRRQRDDRRQRSSETTEWWLETDYLEREIKVRD